MSRYRNYSIEFDVTVQPSRIDKRTKTADNILHQAVYGMLSAIFCIFQLFSTQKDNRSVRLEG